MPFNAIFTSLIYFSLLYRQHVLNSLDKGVFKKPICEVLLDQQYFNGVGNYLRAEVLYGLVNRKMKTSRKTYIIKKKLFLPVEKNQLSNNTDISIIFIESMKNIKKNIDSKYANSLPFLYRKPTKPPLTGLITQRYFNLKYTIFSVHQQSFYLRNRYGARTMPCATIPFY